MVDKICEICGKHYPIGLRNQKQYEKSRFCSQLCFKRHLSKAAEESRAKETKTCRQCGRAYTSDYNRRQAFKRGKYCSLDCFHNSKRRSIDRIFALIRIDPLTGCHEWQGGRNTGGYGHARFRGKRRLVHRIVWEHTNGPVPEELELDHICRNRACCNLEHLRAVSPKENVLAGVSPCAQNALKTNCPKCGGEYSRQKTTGRRYCRVCLNKRQAENVRRKCAEDPEFKQRKLEVNNEYLRTRYQNDPEFRARRIATQKRSRAKLKEKKEQ